jgi:TolC family type I secretion outer membrane protein
MKSIHIKQWVWLLAATSLFLPFIMSTATAQNTPIPVTLTLTQAFQIAVAQNPEVKAAHFQVASVESEVVQARAGFFPQVYFSETFSRTTNPMWAFGTKLNQGAITREDFDPEKLNNPDAINNFVTAVSMSWKVYDGGHTKISWEQAQKNEAAASSMYKRIRQEVIARTGTAYVGLLLAQAQLSVAEQSLETSKINLKMVRSRFKSGFVVKSDLLRAKVRVSELEQQRLHADSQVKVAKAMLNAAMGTSLDRPLILVTPFEECAETKGSLEEWIHTALTNRPDLEKMKYQEDMAKKEISKSRAGHLPDLQLVGNYEIDSEDFSDTADNYAVGAVVQLNLFSGHRISAKVNAAKSSLRRAQEFRKGMEIGVRVQARKSFLNAQSAWKRIQVGQAAVTHAEEGLRIVKNRYNNGLLTIVALLDAEVALQQARISYFKALHDYKVARIQLALASGIIDTDFQ